MSKTDLIPIVGFFVILGTLCLHEGARNPYRNHPPRYNVVVNSYDSNTAKTATHIAENVLKEISAQRWRTTDIPEWLLVDLNELGIRRWNITYHASFSKESLVGGEKITFCLSGGKLGAGACEDVTYVMNGILDGSIFGQIWLEHQMIQKLRK